MSKELEQIAVVFALGATAFVIWRAWRQGNTLGSLNASPPAARASSSTAKTSTLSDAGIAFLKPDAAQLASALSQTINQEDADMGAAMRSAYLTQ